METVKVAVLGCGRIGKLHGTNLVQSVPQAEVVAVGPGGVVDGKEVTMQVKVGDKVIYSKYAGTDVKLGEDEYIVVKQNDIVAIVED